jgi:hypothetical protein
MKIAYVTHFTYILISSVALVGAEKVESGGDLAVCPPLSHFYDTARSHSRR